jgi:hypothetical protein
MIFFNLLPGLTKWVALLETPGIILGEISDIDTVLSEE